MDRKPHKKEPLSRANAVLGLAVKDRTSKMGCSLWIMLIVKKRNQHDNFFKSVKAYKRNWVTIQSLWIDNEPVII